MPAGVDIDAMTNVPTDQTAPKPSPTPTGTQETATPTETPVAGATKPSETADEAAAAAAKKEEYKQIGNFTVGKFAFTSLRSVYSALRMTTVD